ncbi:MAG: ABC transporter permease subunit [Bacteroidota bacterium]
MGHYVLRRLVYAIPTMLAVLIISFLLMSSSPGDSIERRLDLDGLDSYLSRTNYIDAYRLKAAETHGLKPQFYLSVQPSFLSESINNLPTISLRRRAKSLCRETHQCETVVQIWELIGELILSVDRSKENAKLLASLLKLEQSQDLTTLQRRMTAVHPPPADDELQNDWMQLNAAVNKLTHEKKMFYPVLRWSNDNQFHHWLFGRSALFSRSLSDGRSVWDRVGTAVAWTLSMSTIALILIALLSLLMAYTQVKYEGRLIDTILSRFTYAFYAMPLFWLATLAVVFLTTSDYGSWTNWFPSVGIRPDFTGAGVGHRMLDNAGQLVLPIICLVVHEMAYLSRITKRDLLSSSTKVYITASRSRGLSENQVLRKHILPDGLLNYTTVITGAIPALFGGSIVIEVIFNIPGIGRLMLESIGAGDWPVIFAIILIISLTTIIGYLIGDILLMQLYPQTAERVGRHHRADAS